MTLTDYPDPAGIRTLEGNVALNRLTDPASRDLSDCDVRPAVDASGEGSCQQRRVSVAGHLWGCAADVQALIGLTPDGEGKAAASLLLNPWIAGRTLASTGLRCGPGNEHGTSCNSCMDCTSFDA